jgi:hypothetical protein
VDRRTASHRLDFRPGFGAWAWEVSKNPGDIKDLLAKHAQRVSSPFKLENL